MSHTPIHHVPSTHPNLSSFYSPGMAKRPPPLSSYSRAQRRRLQRAAASAPENCTSPLDVMQRLHRTLHAGLYLECPPQETLVESSAWTLQDTMETFLDLPEHSLSPPRSEVDLDSLRIYLSQRQRAASNSLDQTILRLAQRIEAFNLSPQEMQDLRRESEALLPLFSADWQWPIGHPRRSTTNLQRHILELTDTFWVYFQPRVIVNAPSPPAPQATSSQAIRTLPGIHELLGSSSSSSHGSSSSQPEGVQPLLSMTPLVPADLRTATSSLRDARPPVSTRPPPPGLSRLPPGLPHPVRPLLSLSTDNPRLSQPPQLSQPFHPLMTSTPQLMDLDTSTTLHLHVPRPMAASSTYTPTAARSSQDSAVTIQPLLQIDPFQAVPLTAAPRRPTPPLTAPRPTDTYNLLPTPSGTITCHSLVYLPSENPSQPAPTTQPPASSQPPQPLIRQPPPRPSSAANTTTYVEPRLPGAINLNHPVPARYGSPAIPDPHLWRTLDSQGRYTVSSRSSRDGSCHPLSTFHQCFFRFRTHTYASPEECFQANRAYQLGHPEIFDGYRTNTSPGRIRPQVAKMLGRRTASLATPMQRTSLQLGLMHELVYAHALQCEAARQALADSLPFQITHHDLLPHVHNPNVLSHFWSAYATAEGSPGLDSYAKVVMDVRDLLHRQGLLPTPSPVWEFPSPLFPSQTSPAFSTGQPALNISCESTPPAQRPAPTASVSSARTRPRVSDDAEAAVEALFQPPPKRSRKANSPPLASGTLPTIITPATTSDTPLADTANAHPLRSRPPSPGDRLSFGTALALVTTPSSVDSTPPFPLAQQAPSTDPGTPTPNSQSPPLFDLTPDPELLDLPTAPQSDGTHDSPPPGSPAGSDTLSLSPPSPDWLPDPERENVQISTQQAKMDAPQSPDPAIHQDPAPAPNPVALLDPIQAAAPILPAPPPDNLIQIQAPPAPAQAPAQIEGPVKHIYARILHADALGRWRLKPPSSHSVVFWGDSNLRQVDSSMAPFDTTPHSVAIHCMPGLKGQDVFRTAYALYKTWGPQPQVSDFILALGINHRSQHPNTQRPNMRKCLTSLHSLFPRATIHLTEVKPHPDINSLHHKSSENIAFHNRLVFNNLLVLNNRPQPWIRPLTSVDITKFSTLKDLIHWTPTTARLQMEHWFDQLISHWQGNA